MTRREWLANRKAIRKNCKINKKNNSTTDLSRIQSRLNNTK